MRTLLRAVIAVGVLAAFAAVFSAAGVGLAALVLLVVFGVKVEVGVLVGYLIRFVIRYANVGAQGRYGRHKWRVLVLGAMLAHVAYFTTGLTYAAVRTHHAWWLGTIVGLAVNVFLAWTQPEDYVSDDLTDVATTEIQDHH
jgi:hypothetical protein